MVEFRAIVNGVLRRCGPRPADVALTNDEKETFDDNERAMAKNANKI